MPTIKTFTDLTSKDIDIEKSEHKKVSIKIQLNFRRKEALTELAARNDIIISLKNLKTSLMPIQLLPHKKLVDQAIERFKESK